MLSSFVDLQVNGFLGVDFSDGSLTSKQILFVADELLKRGTGAFLPTVITSPIPVYEQVLPILAEAVESSAAAGRLLGIHLEGPFISPEDGAVGAHPKNCVQTPSIELFDHLFALAKGHVRILTVAPERPGAEALIAYAVRRGVTVSVGHSLCGENDVARAVAAGATLSTHLGNGIPNLLNRHANPVYSQLASSLIPMLISDGHHIPSAFLKIVCAAKGCSRFLMTSDSAPVAKLPEGEYKIFGTSVQICSDGAIRNLNAPTLAGSSAAMIDCMNWASQILPHLSEKDLWTISRDNPLRAIGLASLGNSLPKIASCSPGKAVQLLIK